MSKKSSPSSPSLGQVITSVVQTIQAKLDFRALRLKKGAKVAKIRVKNGENSQVDVYPLIGDRYIIGRSSRSCDIVVRNPIISTIHCTIEKHPRNPKRFVIKDQNSTNGLYFGKHRYQAISLRHGDVVTLGPPELRNGIEISFNYSPPSWLLILRYSLYGSTFILILILGWMGQQWSKYQVYPLPHGISGPVIVYSEDGKTPLAPRISSIHRELDKLSDFSPYLPLAVIASEDSRYFWHLGLDPLGIARAILINARAKGWKQGASTITQQLARSLFPSVGRENTIERKLREILVALKLEAVYSKNEILKTYLNRVYLGVNSYGFEDAAQFYFAKSAADLDIAQAATLVAILPAPNAYNPVQDYDTALALRNRVIQRMYELGMISREDATRARRSRIEISSKARQTLSNLIAPYFYSYVLRELNFLLGNDLAKEGDFIVETSLNPQIQSQTETALQEYLDTYGSQYDFSQGAIATLNTKTGEIVALVGGKDYNKSQFNRATQAQRQPGSTFKVFAYAAALEQGISPHKSYSCGGLTWQGISYQPCERTSGSADMYRGLAQSENAIALRVAQDVGLERVVNIARRFGIKSNLEKVPGLILGQSEVNVLEMTGAYAAFANEGIWHRPHGIKVIRDGRDCQNNDQYQTCRIIYQFNQDGSEQKQSISSEIAQTVTEMMQEAVISGTGRSAYVGQGEAGKTGTTNNGVDLWFIGYIRDRNQNCCLATGIWLGNDDNSSTKGTSAQAASLWGKIYSATP
jgi:membrane peptidoglycan carboxypeptidase